MAAPADVEADETTFDKKDLGSAAADPANSIEWEQWCGMVQRGVPSSLVLSCLMPKISAKRAPGPGAIRKMEWGPLAKKHLQGRQVILHTDAAKSYKTKINGMLHDNVRHCKKRVKVAGKFVWKAPVYVRLAVHKCPKTGKKVQVKAGTQIIDRAWRFLKERIHVQSNSKVGSSTPQSPD